MATTYTTHLQLPKHAPTDPFDISLINEMADKTEEGILSAYKCGAAHNLLDNSYFLNPVNQDGEVIYTGSRKHNIDRWRAYHAGTTHTITASGLAVDTNDGSNPNLYQALDANLIDTSKTYTAACCDSNGNIYVKTMKLTDTTYAPVCLYLSGGSILFRIIGAKTWRWAALYEGEYTVDTLPTYVPKGYAAELAECKRYYQKVRVNAVQTHAANAYYACAYVHNMRIVPTVTLKEFAPIGYVSITDFTGCMTSADEYSLIYAKLPTCTSRTSGVLTLTLSADL